MFERSKRRISLGLLLFSCTASLLLAGCRDLYEPPPVRVGSNSWPGYEPLFLAETLNLYPANSVHIVETPLNMGLVQAFRGATIDVAAASLSRALFWANDGVDLTILLILDSSSGADQIVARPGIKTPAQLKGHVIAGELASVNGYLMMRALEAGGLTPDDVTIRDMENVLLPQAYATGEIDAASAFGESLDALIAAGGTPIFDSSQIPGEISDVLVVRTPYLRKHPERIKDLLKGWIKARKTMENWPADTPFPIGSGQPTLQDVMLNGIHLTRIEENIAFLASGAEKLKALMQKRLNVSARLGLIRANAALPRVNTSLFMEALEEARKEAPHLFKATPQTRLSSGRGAFRQEEAP